MAEQGLTVDELKQYLDTQVRAPPLSLLSEEELDQVLVS
jgi:hypothetical protein